MHFEFLVEDSSGKALLEHIVPQILGPKSQPHTWRIISYKGVGRLPKNLDANPNPQHRILLDRLPAILRGYERTPGYDHVFVVVDADRRKIQTFERELKTLAKRAAPQLRTTISIAVEEIEAWYLGDLDALRTAYPRIKNAAVSNYVQDSICGTWEALANATVPGGANSLNDQGYVAVGEQKHKWANAIGPKMDVRSNRSPSFNKFKEQLLAAAV